MSFGASGCCMHPFIQEETDNIVLQDHRLLPLRHRPAHQNPHLSGQACGVADVEKETIPGGPAEEDPTVAAMSRYLLDQIPDGACIQLGIGGVATAVGYGLMSKNDLGCHTEMMSDSIMALMKARRSSTTAGLSLSPGGPWWASPLSRALYEFLDHNEDLFFGPFPVVNNPVNIAPK